MRNIEVSKILVIDMISEHWARYTNKIIKNFINTNNLEFEITKRLKDISLNDGISCAVLP